MKMTEIGGLRVFSSKADPMIDQLVYEGGGKRKVRAYVAFFVGAVTYTTTSSVEKLRLSFKNLLGS